MYAQFSADEALSPDRTRGVEVWVVGDAMLDEYVDGRTLRQSPEASVPVLRVDLVSHRPGGAANVANCVVALGASAVLAAVVGPDAAGEELLRLCRNAGIDTRALRPVSDRPTTRKTRVLVAGEHLVRIDRESTTPIQVRHGEACVEALAAGGVPHALVFSNYAKGMLSAQIVEKLVAKARKYAVPVIVDSNRGDWRWFRGASLLALNLRQLKTATGRGQQLVDPREVEIAARDLVQNLENGAVLVMLGERGMVLVQPCGATQWLDARATSVVDTTGAGDAAIAVLAVALGSGLDLVDAVHLGNAAAGVVVGKFGTAAATSREIIATFDRSRARVSNHSSRSTRSSPEQR